MTNTRKMMVGFNSMLPVSALLVDFLLLCLFVHINIICCEWKDDQLVPHLIEMKYCKYYRVNFLLCVLPKLFSSTINCLKMSSLSQVLFIVEISI